MKRLFFLFLLAVFLFLVSCRKDIPEPEIKDNSIDIMEKEAVQTSLYFMLEEKDPFLVQYNVEGKNVYIECVVTGLSFRKHEAKVNLYVDGAKKNEIHTAAFVVKDLEPGQHHIKLELMQQNSHIVVATREFNVQVP